MRKTCHNSTEPGYVASCAVEQLDVHVDIAEQLMYDLDSQAAAHSRLGIRLA